VWRLVWLARQLTYLPVIELSLRENYS